MMEPISPNMAKVKKWADDALSTLALMKMDDRHFWNATAPRGEQHFNHRRVSYVCRILPEYRSKFTDLGISVR